MLTAEKFLGILDTRDPPTSIFLLGTIDPAYVSGRPKIQFDGESTVSIRQYPYLSSYTPVASARVLLAVVGHGAVVLGKIV